MTLPLPSRKQEDWRYADIEALRAVWEQHSEPSTVVVGPGEELEQLWLPNGDAVELRRVILALGEGSRARVSALNCASAYGRIELEVSLAEGSQFEFLAANIGGGDATNEIVTKVRHVSPKARSLQVVRSVLNGRATGSYLGKIEVARAAQQSDAEQSIKAILLDRGATANAKPELEIFADDVRCAHGAAVGELDPMQLFYAESRGIEPSRARLLLLQGFIMGLWDGRPERDAIGTCAHNALEEIL